MRHLLVQRHFGPYFLTQFLGALNDNFYKTAMLLAIVYRLQAGDPQQAAILSQLAAAVFILPFFLFSLWAGGLADRYDKAMLIRRIKAAEIIIMLIGGLGLMYGHIGLLFAALFGMGTHSAFFGPVKYAIIPQHVDQAHLTQATGLVEAGTFLAILSGQLWAGLMVPAHSIAVMIAVAVAGYGAALFIPAATAATQEGAASASALTSWRLAWHFLARAEMRRPILRISYFWALGLLLTTQLAPLVVDMLRAPQMLVSFYLALFSIGIACGALLAMRLSRAYSPETLVRAAAVLIALMLLLLYAMLSALHPLSDTAGLSQTQGRVLLGLILFMLATVAGVYIVPLYVFLQKLPEPHQRARLLAINNISNSAIMVLSSLLAAAAQISGADSAQIILGSSFLWTFCYWFLK